ncbi:MAG: hypothetical protein V3U27_21430 [Candidatus Tectomicrobia bacterium]
MTDVYTTAKVYALLTNYQRRALAARPRPREDRLGTQQAPLEEAPYAASSRVWADIEAAMHVLPPTWDRITFAVLCLGGSEKEPTSWRNGMSLQNWREKVGDFYDMRVADINKIVGESVREMTDTLNGIAVTNDPA